MTIILSWQIPQWFYCDQKEGNRVFNTILVCIHINSLVTGLHRFVCLYNDNGTYLLSCLIAKEIIRGKELLQITIAKEIFRGKELGNNDSISLSGSIY